MHFGIMTLTSLHQRMLTAFGYIVLLNISVSLSVVYVI